MPRKQFIEAHGALGAWEPGTPNIQVSGESLREPS